MNLLAAWGDIFIFCARAERLALGSYNSLKAKNMPTTHMSNKK